MYSFHLTEQILPTQIKYLTILLLTYFTYTFIHRMISIDVYTFFCIILPITNVLCICKYAWYVRTRTIRTVTTTQQIQS